MANKVEEITKVTPGHATKPSALTRRKLVGITAGASGLLLAPAIFPSRSRAFAADLEPEVVFACDGGSTQRMFEEHFFSDFTKMTGTKVTYVPGQPADTLAKMRVQKASPAIDIAWLAGGVTYLAIDEGLVADIDRAQVPNAALINPNAGAEKAALPFGVTVCALGYNTDIFTKQGFAAPDSWWDMWDQKYKGHVGMYSVNLTATIALIAEFSKLLSGDDKNVDATFAKFKQLRPNMLNFFSSAGAIETATQQGDLWLQINTTVRTMQMKNSGMPIATVIPKEGTVGYQTWLTQVKGSKHPKAALALINYLLSTENQEKMVSLIGYAPVNTKAVIPASLSGYFPKLSNVFIPDWRYLSQQIPKYVDRWNREVER